MREPTIAAAEIKNRDRARQAAQMAKQATGGVGASQPLIMKRMGGRKIGKAGDDVIRKEPSLPGANANVELGRVRAS